MGTDSFFQEPLPIGYELREYRIEGVLGTSRRSITYTALDTYLGSRVAIKEYYPARILQREEDQSLSVQQPGYSEKYALKLGCFLEEVRGMAKLRHPNIARVMRYFSDNHTGYLVVEFEEGQTLEQYLQGVIDESIIKQIFIPLLQGLEVAHEQGICHGDIKPSNIYLRESGVPMLIDFGSASSTILHEPSSYVAYEQHKKAEDSCIASDIYSLGACMYHCLAGVEPTPVTQRVKEIAAGFTDPLLPAVTRGEAHYSHSLLTLIDRMLMLSPEHRPDSVSVVLETLDGRQAGRRRDAVVPIIHKTNPKVHDRNKGERKLLICGPAGVGKTTAVKMLSDTLPVVTDEKASDEIGKLNKQTTVAMDYGVMKLHDKERLHIYGTPGQERFNFMWQVLQTGAIGLILLIDNARKDPLRDLDQFLLSFKDLIEKTQLVIGVTHTDITRTPSISDYHAHLANKDFVDSHKIPVFSVDARNREQMILLIQALVYSIDPEIEVQSMTKNITEDA